MNCARCDLELAPGATHQTPLDCIEALKNALDCPNCGEPLELCPRCHLKDAALNKAGELGMKALNAGIQRLSNYKPKRRQT